MLASWSWLIRVILTCSHNPYSSFNGSFGPTSRFLKTLSCLWYLLKSYIIKVYLKHAFWNIIFSMLSVCARRKSTPLQPLRAKSNLDNHSWQERLLKFNDLLVGSINTLARVFRIPWKLQGFWSAKMNAGADFSVLFVVATSHNIFLCLQSLLFSLNNPTT